MKKLERLHELAAKFVATNPDVIVAGFGTETAKAAQAATTAIPIIFTSVGDPIRAGIVSELATVCKLSICVVACGC